MNNWRVIVAVVVALLVGAGAGVLGEHQRLKDDSNKKSTSSSKKTTTTKKGTSKTTTKKPAVADFFGSKTTQACPALKDWNVAAVASYTALYEKVPWATTKVKLSGELDAMTTAFVAMEGYANATGKTALAAQIAYQSKSKTALAGVPFVGRIPQGDEGVEHRGGEGRRRRPLRIGEEVRDCVSAPDATRPRGGFRRDSRRIRTTRCRARCRG